MKRYVASLAGCGLVMLVIVLFAPLVGARATAANPIGGVVVNATHQNAPVVGQKVILQRSAGNVTQDIASTITDKDGHFSFADVTGASSGSFAVYTNFEGGMFPSQIAIPGSGAATSVQLKVYDTTNDDAHLRVTVATLLVRQPRPINGLIGIGAVVTIENTGTTAFVGTPTGDASKPMRLLRFATPANASNLSLGIGFDGTQIFTTDRGFGSTATVPPGTTDFAYGIDIPYTGTVADISYRAVYPTARIVVLVPPDMFVDGRDFQARGIVDNLGTRYQVFTAANAPVASQVALHLTGLPQAGEKSYLDARALGIFAIVLALLALLVLVVYLRRGSLATAVGLIPSQAPEKPWFSVPEHVTTNDAAEYERLLKALLTLEQARGAGKITDARIRQQDRDLRSRLRALMSFERSGISPAGAVSGGDTDTRAAEMSAPEAASEQSSGGR
jgi:flagellar basal body-associated protein FliL